MLWWLVNSPASYQLTHRFIHLIAAFCICRASSGCSSRSSDDSSWLEVWRVCSALWWTVVQYMAWPPARPPEGLHWPGPSRDQAWHQVDDRCVGTPTALHNELWRFVKQDRNLSHSGRDGKGLFDLKRPRAFSCCRNSRAKYCLCKILSVSGGIAHYKASK